MTIPAHIQRLCDEFGIRVIDRNRYPEPGETRAVETMARIYRRHGEAHLRMVLTTIMQAGNNKLLLDETGLWAVSDMVRACGGLIEREAGAWLDLWDQIPGGELQFICTDLRGIVPQRFALDGMLYERIVRRFGPHADQLDLLDDRRRA